MLIYFIVWSSVVIEILERRERGIEVKIVIIKWWIDKIYIYSIRLCEEVWLGKKNVKFVVEVVKKND